MFTAKKKSLPAVPVRMPGRGGSFSVVSEDAVIAGNLATAANLQLNGRIEGDVRCGALDQRESGTIVGNIVADEARLAGLVDGTVCAGLLILEPTARVTGDVSYETLSIESGARVEGRFAHRTMVGEKAQLSPSPLIELWDEDTAEAAE